MTQTTQILSYLKAGKRLTPNDALREFGCFRLGARIYDLKQAGHSIARDMVEVKTRHGLSRVAEYRLRVKHG